MHKNIVQVLHLIAERLKKTQFEAGHDHMRYSMVDLNQALLAERSDYYVEAETRQRKDMLGQHSSSGRCWVGRQFESMKEREVTRCVVLSVKMRRGKESAKIKI